MIFSIGKHIVYFNNWLLPTIFWYSYCEDKSIKELTDEYNYKYYHQWETVNGECRVTSNIHLEDLDKPFSYYLEEAKVMIFSFRNKSDEI